MNHPNDRAPGKGARRSLTAVLLLIACAWSKPVQAQAPAVEVAPEHAVAVERGLAYLAGTQNSDGSWTGKVGFKLNNGYHFDREQGHVGVTSLVMMSYLAGGYLPGRGPYGEVVGRGLDWIMGCAQEDGYLSAAVTRMYSHAFATLLLAEIYGMTHREDVRLVLQRAVDFIVDVQNEEGGWRYEPFAAESDMSIVVCQVMALRAARNIGIRVPKSTVDLAIRSKSLSRLGIENRRRTHRGLRFRAASFRSRARLVPRHPFLGTGGKC